LVLSLLWPPPAGPPDSELPFAAQLVGINTMSLPVRYLADYSSLVGVSGLDERPDSGRGEGGNNRAPIPARVPSARHLIRGRARNR